MPCAQGARYLVYHHGNGPADRDEGDVDGATYAPDSTRETEPGGVVKIQQNIVNRVADRLLGGRLSVQHHNVGTPWAIGLQDLEYCYGEDLGYDRHILKDRLPGLLGVMTFPDPDHDYIVYEDQV